MLTFMISKNLSARAASRHPQAPVRIPRSTLARWKQSYDWWGETPAATKRRIKKKLRGGRGRRSMSDVDVQALKHIVDRRPQLYLDQMQRALRRVLDVTFNIRTIHRYLTKPPAQGGLGYSLKVLSYKAMQATAFDRKVYLGRLRQVTDPAQLVFVDESSVGKNAGRQRRGWGRMGGPSPAFELFAEGEFHGNTFTLIAAVDLNGFIEPACKCVFRKRSATDADPARGTVDTEMFLSWIQNSLCPTLGHSASNQPRSIVVMDNATIHRDDRIQAAIEAVGATVIWTAAYSPDLNPIERCFSYYKKYLLRHSRLFARRPKEAHRRALCCVSGKTMRNLYNGKALQGAIKHVYTEEDEQTAVVLGAVVAALVCD